MIIVQMTLWHIFIVMPILIILSSGIIYFLEIKYQKRKLVNFFELLLFTSGELLLAWWIIIKTSEYIKMHINISMSDYGLAIVYLSLFLCFIFFVVFYTTGRIYHYIKKYKFCFKKSLFTTIIMVLGINLPLFIYYNYLAYYGQFTPNSPEIKNGWPNNFNVSYNKSDDQILFSLAKNNRLIRKNLISINDSTEEFINHENRIIVTINKNFISIKKYSNDKLTITTQTTILRWNTFISKWNISRALLLDNIIIFISKGRLYIYNIETNVLFETD